MPAVTAEPVLRARRLRRPAPWGAVVVAGAILAGCTGSTGAGQTWDVPPSPANSATAMSGAVTSGALTSLAALPVRDRESQGDFSRSQFGQAWSDDVTVDGGHNGCDTRNDILRRDLTAPQIKPGTQGCLVLAGTLIDSYTGARVAFLRGAATSDDVQIDHLVALSDAWQTGAAQLTAARRQDLANDPLNLQAVSGSVNQAKGDGDAAEWLPPDVGYRCTYVTRQIEVKARYDLWVTAAERDAMAGVLAGCGATAPAPAPVPQARDATVPELSAPAVGRPPTVPPSTPGAVSYQDCAAVRAAGAARLSRGQPGYSSSMDGDGDGIACEN